MLKQKHRLQQTRGRNWQKPVHCTPEDWGLTFRVLKSTTVTGLYNQPRHLWTVTELLIPNEDSPDAQRTPPTYPFSGSHGTYAFPKVRNKWKPNGRVPRKQRTSQLRGMRIFHDDGEEPAWDSVSREQINHPRLEYRQRSWRIVWTQGQLETIWYALPCWKVFKCAHTNNLHFQCHFQI